jgi:hypothetical protein
MHDGAAVQQVGRYLVGGGYPGPPRRESFLTHGLSVCTWAGLAEYTLAGGDEPLSAIRGRQTTCAVPVPVPVGHGKKTKQHKKPRRPGRLGARQSTDAVASPRLV